MAVRARSGTIQCVRPQRRARREAARTGQIEGHDADKGEDDHSAVLVRFGHRRVHRRQHRMDAEGEAKGGERAAEREYVVGHDPLVDGWLGRRVTRRLYEHNECERDIDGDCDERRERSEGALSGLRFARAAGLATGRGHDGDFGERLEEDVQGYDGGDDQDARLLR
eukprot:3610155-Prymnesium_polylepis.1